MAGMVFQRLPAIGAYHLPGQRRSCLLALDGIPCLVPCHKATPQGEGTVPLARKERRHTGARKLIRSGTVGDDRFVAR